PSGRRRPGSPRNRSVELVVPGGGPHVPTPGDQPAEGFQDGRLAAHLLDPAVLVLEPHQHPGQLAHVTAHLLEEIAGDLEVVGGRLDLAGGQPGVGYAHGGQLESALDRPGHVAQDVVMIQPGAPSAETDGGNGADVSGQRTTQVSPRRSRLPRSAGERSRAAAIWALAPSS